MKTLNNQKKWEILPKVDDLFIKNLSYLSPLVIQLLKNRGISKKEDAENFLNPDFFSQSPDPFLFKDMEKAVDLIIENIKAGKKIIIYGDYDADGVTSCALLQEILSLLKGNIEIYIPSRASEGYGINIKSLDFLKKEGADLIITVDNGIRNKFEVSYAKKLGINIIITDHHLPSEDENDLPECLIINARKKDETYPFKELAGVGVAYKLASAIIKKSKLNDELKEKILLSILDLVAIGTIADCVNLLGENRILVIEGLKIINKRKRIGLDELIKISNINKKIDSFHIGWMISPRLNAAGRLDHANTAYQLLVCKDRGKARRIAEDLNKKNIERQKITEEIINQVEEIIKDNNKDKIIIAKAPSLTGLDDVLWNEGVIGLAAGRICEKYYLPTLIIASNGQEIKGSGRSIDEFNIVEALENFSKYLSKYGGHSAACGFSIENKEMLEKFIKEIKIYAHNKLKNIDLFPRVYIEAEINLENINKTTVNEIEKFSPFGEGNEKVKLISNNVKIADIIFMGSENQHIKIKIKNNDSIIFSAIGFGQSEQWRNLSIGDNINIVYFLEFNNFNGYEEIQLKIIDIKKNE